MSTPLERYQRDLKERGFTADPAQRVAVEHLQRLYEDLVAAELESQDSHLPARLWKMLTRSDLVEPIRGLYFWGGVGRGKTWLVDTFFDSLPFERKMRTHFHRFMQRVHRDLRGLAGEKNPLELIAAQLARETRIICFDEFFVSDITDAMLLAGLLDGLFSRGVTLVATSNIEPQGLYRDGLQRSRFLPAIELMVRHTLVVNIDGGTDYRLRALERAELYHSPLDEGADLSLRRSFDSLAPEPGRELEKVEINGRMLQSRVCADDVIWFEFAELCDGPRSQNDYIELARIFHAIIVSNVPQMGLGREDQARRFINLVDELYDHNVKLVLSAEMELNQLYQGSQLDFEFARTISRLQEMQSHEYLAKEHRP